MARIADASPKYRPARRGSIAIAVRNADTASLVMPFGSSTRLHARWGVGAVVVLGDQVADGIRCPLHLVPLRRIDRALGP